MKKQKRQLLILLAILLVCIVCYFAAGAYSTYVTEQEALAEADYEVLTFEDGDLAQMKVEGSEGELILNYDGSTWTFENDINAVMEDETTEYEVNETTASTMLNYLNSLTSEYEITPNEDLSEYGLDDPSMTITLTMTDGTVHSLVFGDYNEMVTAYYYYLDDADVLYIMESYTYGILNKSDADLADEVEEEEEEEEESSEDASEEEEDSETDESAGEEDTDSGEDAGAAEDSETDEEE